jgi:16S rRNA (uracil1498-N3)-methyltransferase
LPAQETHHACVLRLQPRAQVELFDGAGRAWRAELADDRASAVLVEESRPAAGRDARATAAGPRLVLASAWPKGKRAAFLVEKCTELGVAEIVPLVCARSVVVKSAQSAGMMRLRRIASEAAKQSGRRAVPAIGAPSDLQQFLSAVAPGCSIVLLDPRAPRTFSEWLAGRKEVNEIAALVGPEGGFTEEEMRLAEEHGAIRVRLSQHVLRVETAAVAACAVWAARLGAISA